MTTNTILDDAEERVSDAHAHTKTTQTQIIDAMREEIGRQHYAQAKVTLPELERAMAKTYRPFVERVTGISAQAKAALPPDVQGWLRDMMTACDTVPTVVRQGIDGWDRLMPPIWKDGRSLDLAVRAQLVHDIRFCLRNGDGRQGSLDNLQAQVEHYIMDSGWPSRA